jgi:hypothetical protein
LRKAWILLVAIIILTFSLIGCGQNNEQNYNQNGQQSPFLTSDQGINNQGQGNQGGSPQGGDTQGGNTQGGSGI